jgi:uncharacterized protein YkwD
MKTIFRLTFIVAFLSCCNITQLQAQPGTPELLEAFDLLNRIRENPSAYSTQVGIDLSGITPRKALIWNPILSKVAQTKAEDMAKRNYFGHVDPDGYGMNYYVAKAGYTLPFIWTSEKSANYCESIAAGINSPVQGILTLVNDNEPDHQKAGHRSHLLGVDSFYAQAYDIGIGWYYDASSYYQTYMVIVIARHE